MTTKPPLESIAQVLSERPLLVSAADAVGTLKIVYKCNLLKWLISNQAKIGVLMTVWLFDRIYMPEEAFT